MYTLYSMQRSGNSYKVRLALAQLGLPYRLVEVDILQGESHTPEFLAMNPNGQVPLLEVAPGRYLAESNAILWYVAGGTPLGARRPHRSRRGAAMDVLRAAQPRAQYRRRLFLARAGQGRTRTAATRARRLDGGRLPLARRDGEPPQAHRFFAANRYTVADIALYAYTHLAHLCDYDLDTFPAIRAWLDRVAAEPHQYRWTGSRRRLRRNRPASSARAASVHGEGRPA